MKRSQAAALIDQLREALAYYEQNGSAESLRNRMQDAFRSADIAPLEVCPGEAHSNAFIDKCITCAPRWGFVGPAVRVT